MVHYYVNSDTGNDANDGSEGSPVATITQAFTLIDAIEVRDSGPHEVIITNDAVYNEAFLGFAPLLATTTIVYIMGLTGSDGQAVNTPTIQGSGSSVQTRGLYAGRGWIINNLKFSDWIIFPSNGIIEQRSHGYSDPTVVKNCIFTNITGSCFTVDLGASDNGPYRVEQNVFHNIMCPTSSETAPIRFTDPKKCYVFNNLFYDIQYGNVNARLISLEGTRLPDNIIAHNTFGTSSVQEGTTVEPRYTVYSPGSTFDYNIIYEQTAAQEGFGVSTFAVIDGGEANYNIYYNVTGESSHAPFGTGTVTGTVGNIEADPQFKGPLLVGDNANYRLAGTNSPAFDAALGSSNVTNDLTGVSRIFLDQSALETGIFDIGAYELTGLWSTEASSSTPTVASDFTINRIEKANTQFKRALAEGNENVIGRDITQVPFTTAMNGAVPAFIRKKPSHGGGYKVNEG
jgi:hypothetical protein